MGRVYGPSVSGRDADRPDGAGGLLRRGSHNRSLLQKYRTDLAGVARRILGLLPARTTRRDEKRARPRASLRRRTHFDLYGRRMSLPFAQNALRDCFGRSARVSLLSPDADTGSVSSTLVADRRLAAPPPSRAAEIAQRSLPMPAGTRSSAPPRRPYRR